MYRWYQYRVNVWGYRLGVLFFFIELGKTVKNKLLFTMTAYPIQTRMTLGAAQWDSQAQPDVMQPEFKPGTVVTPLSTEMQCLRLLRHSGALSGTVYVVVFYICVFLRMHLLCRIRMVLSCRMMV